MVGVTARVGPTDGSVAGATALEEVELIELDGFVDVPLGRDEQPAVAIVAVAATVRTADW